MKTLAQKAQEYDNLNNEGGEGYNPYRQQLKDQAIREYNATHVRDEYDVLRDLERYDCSIARECGTYDAEKVSALRAELQAIRDKAEADFREKWTPEYTQKIREEWNASMKACKGDIRQANQKIMEYAKKGISMNDLKKAIKINNL